MSNKITTSYVTNFPLKGDSPKLNIEPIGDFTYQFINLDNGEIIYDGLTQGAETIHGSRQWYTRWGLKLRDKSGNVIFEDVFNPKGKVIVIKIDGYALGDNIAWIPYVEEFRKKHQCTVICSTFWNDLFIETYPDIIFVEPNVKVENTYAQYYIGASDEYNPMYSPIITKNRPLQMVASEILGLPYKEEVGLVKPPTHPINLINTPYVCISEYASHKKKMWGEEDGWQKIVDFLVSQGYKVVVISKEKTNLKNVVDKSGDFSIQDRINDIHHCQFYMGVSSGLSWLAWGLLKPVVMISDHTPHYHEFQTNMVRFGQNVNGVVDYTNEKITPVSDVISRLSGITNLGIQST